MKNPTRLLLMTSAMAATMLLGGCNDDCDDCPPQKEVVYAWDIPKSQDDCAAGTIFTDTSDEGGGDQGGGTGIVDRDGGTGIVDRDNNFVQQYCLQPCVGDEVPSGSTIMAWDNPNNFVEAYRHRCESPSDGENGGDQDQ